MCLVTNVRHSMRTISKNSAQRTTYVERLNDERNKMARGGDEMRRKSETKRRNLETWYNWKPTKERSDETRSGESRGIAVLLGRWVQVEMRLACRWNAVSLTLDPTIADPFPGPETDTFRYPKPVTPKSNHFRCAPISASNWLRAGISTELCHRITLHLSNVHTYLWPTFRLTLPTLGLMLLPLVSGGIFIGQTGSDLIYRYGEKCCSVTRCDFEARNRIVKRGLTAGAHPRGGCRAAAPPPNPPKWKFKKHRFCRYYDIKSFTWVTLQPKSATKIGWWLAHYKFEK
jgi:hypothetical protein